MLRQSFAGRAPAVFKTRANAVKDECKAKNLPELKRAARTQLLPQGVRQHFCNRSTLIKHQQRKFMRKKMSTAATAIAGLLVLSLQGLPSPACAETGPAENSKPPLQIVNLTELKVALQVNYADTVPNGVSKQVMAAKNLYDHYTALGMKAGKDFDIVMVFRADGAQFLLTDEAYEQKVKSPQAKGNPSRALLDELARGGVKMYECGVAMRLKGYTAPDLLPYSRIVVSGIGALVDFEKSGFLPITP